MIKPKHGELLARTRSYTPKPVNPVAGAVVAGGMVMAVFALGTLLVLGAAAGASWLVYHFLVGWNRGKAKENLRGSAE